MSSQSPKQPLRIQQERIYDKLDLLKEHIKITPPDTGRILLLITQVESLVESIEDTSTAS